MSGWLKNKDLRGWADIGAKLLIGLAGLAITYLLSSTQHELQQSQDKAEDLRYTSSQFDKYLEKFIEGKYNKTYFNMLEYLSRKIEIDHNIKNHREIFSQASSAQNIKVELEKTEISSFKHKSLLSEQSGVMHIKNEYFCVIYSSRDIEKARKEAKRASDVLLGKNAESNTRIYFSEITKYYAVTVGGPSDIKQIKERVAVARIEISGDSYPAKNLEWKYLERCNASECMKNN